LQAKAFTPGVTASLAGQPPLRKPG